MLDAMASPLFSATWWLPALHRGEISPDDLIEALLPWGKDHRIVTGDGHTYSGLVELLRITRPWDIRFLQVLPGAYSELPTTPPGTHELVESATEEESVLSTTALGELISTAGGEALALGHPHEHPDGPFEVSFMTPLRDVVLWLSRSLSGTTASHCQCGTACGIRRLTSCGGSITTETAAHSSYH